VPGRCLDLSAAAMKAVGGLASGVIPVSYEVLARV
jgi:rare lipoprotein A